MLWGVEYALFSSNSLFAIFSFDRQHNDLFTMFMIAGAMASSLFVAALSARKRKHFFKNGRVVTIIVLTSLALFGMAILGIDFGGNHSFRQIGGAAAGALIGWSVAWLTLLWQSSLFERESENPLPLLATGCLIGSVICLILQSSDSVLAFPAGLICILFSGILLALQRTEKKHEERSEKRHTQGRALGILALPLLYTCITRLIFTASSKITIYQMQNFSDVMEWARLAIFVADILFFIIIFLGIKISLHHFFNAVFVALGAALLFLPSIGTEHSQYLLATSSVCAHVSFLILTAAAFEAIRLLQTNVFIVLGVVNGCIRASSLFGIVLSEILFKEGYDLLQLTSFTLIAMYLIGAALIFTISKLTKAQGAMRAGPTVESLAIADLSLTRRRELEELAEMILWQRCSAISKAQLLTNRESEILFELAKGKSIATIASDLCISVNTVKTHTKMVYAKVGVHSRQGLADLVNRTRIPE